MSDLKNPNDSLQDYFDELLFGMSVETDVKTELSFPPLEVVTPDVKTVNERVVESVVSVQQYIVEKTVPFTAPASETASEIVAAPATLTAAATTSTIASPQFADPLAKQKEVLQKLLRSAQPIIPVVSTEAAVVAPVTLKTDLVEIQEWDIGTATSTIIESATNLDVAIAQAEAEQSYHMPGVEWMPNGLPQWAQAKFDVLLVEVSGLTLAVPLISLGQIQPITDELTHIFGQADWFIGIQPTKIGKVRVVNTAKFVMPERYDENFVKSAKFLVSINGVPWGLAVDSVNQPISLEPEAIRWRTDRTKRPWIAGIIKEQMCALLDIPMIGQMLMESDKNLSKNHV